MSRETRWTECLTCGLKVVLWNHNVDELFKRGRLRTRKPAYVVRRDYGASELKRVYGKNLMRGLQYSLALNLLLVGCYWGVCYREPAADTQAVTVRLTKYADLFPPPRIPEKTFGLTAYPIAQRSTGANRIHERQVIHAGPKNKLKHAPVAARGFGEVKGDLPSAPGANKMDPAKFLADNSNDDALQSDELNAAGGGANSNDKFPGGKLLASRDGTLPGGNVHSGVGANVRNIIGGEGDNGGGQGGDDERLGGGDGGTFGYSMSWLDGGVRRKISGALPKYPSGVNVEAQIDILAVVAPDGSVKSVQPAQKGNSKLENAAMRELRYWKFEPLRFSVPQIDQTCVVTFNFKLR
jgi:hypothetical protein